MITSKANPLIRQARSLRQARGRTKTDLFLVEGVQQVGAAIESGWELDTVLFAPDLLRSEYGLGLLKRFRGRLEEVSATVLESIADRESPQGILAIARRRHLSPGAAAPMGGAAALVSPQDPGNVGTILRTLDAVGASALYLLDGGADPFHPTAVRASMGAVFVIPIREASFDAFVKWSRSHEVRLIGSSARGDLDYTAIQPKAPWILLLGSEQKGLSESQRLACDQVVALPMRGKGTSLNLGVAAGILLYAYRDSIKR